MQEKIKPIKRSAELVPLSRDHHDGLLLYWKINYGLNNQIDLQRIADYTLFFYEQELKLHFVQEETFVFDLLPDNDPMKIEALAQHDLLNGLYTTMKYSPVNMADVLKQFADELNNHIRFEERKLFPYIEKTADPVLFKEAGQKIADIHQKNVCMVWEDEFWTKKN